MPRSAVDLEGRYTEEEVLSVVHADLAQKPDVTIEVYDRDGNPRPDIRPVVKEATVEFVASRLINHSLTLVMEPIPALERALFQFVLSPVVGIGPMPDGGTARHRWGRYLWTRASSEVIGLAATNVEDWTVTLPSLDYLLNLNGPSRRGFVAAQDWPVTTAYAFALHRAGETDLSRVAVSDIALRESLNWTLAAGPRAERRLGAQEYAQALATWQATLLSLAAARENEANQVASDPPEPTRVQGRDLQDRGIKWLDVLETLGGLLGYSPPHRDMEGRPVAEPAPDPSDDDPAIRYRTDRSHVIIPPVSIEPDYTRLANVVYVKATSNANVNPGTVVGIADLDELLPDHPLAARNSHVLIEDVIDASQPLSQEAADAQAKAELFASLRGYESISFDTPLNPQHEGFELLDVQIDGHPDLAEAQVVTESSWKASLVRGRMTHSCARAFRVL